MKAQLKDPLTFARALASTGTSLLRVDRGIADAPLAINT